MGGLSKESVVLEIGCGVARIGRELAPFVKEWHGVDISRQMLTYAKQRTRHLPNVTFYELHDTALPMFDGGVFDFVYCTIVFMHLDKEDLYEYLKESFRVLKAGARSYFDSANLLHDRTFEHFLQTQSYNLGDRKVRNRNQYSTPQELRKYLEKVGFEVLDLREEELIKAVCRKPG
jgi:ubiquinone/menaquinone biosynthesis C-methylase UbiE